MFSKVNIKQNLNILRYCQKIKSIFEKMRILYYTVNFYFINVTDKVLD